VIQQRPQMAADAARICTERGYAWEGYDASMSLGLSDSRRKTASSRCQPKKRRCKKTQDKERTWLCLYVPGLAILGALFDSGHSVRTPPLLGESISRYLVFEP
jgi:hypothetical protein